MAVVDRWTSRRVWLLATVLALITTLMAGTASAAGDPPLKAAASGETVTLITGDRVRLTGDGGVVLDRAVGRDHVTFLSQQVGEDLYVIPSDALPLLRDGRLDKRLFNVTLLREVVYQERSELPLIITVDGAARAARAPAATSGAEVVADLPAVNGVAVQVEKTETGGFWDSLTDQGAAGVARMGASVPKVWLDGLRQPLLDESVVQVGAPAAWDVGLDGSGTTVAVLDTGIDATHPDLADRVADQENFTEGFEDDRDLVGHGTHVASIVAGSGAASGGQFRGVAHGAQLLDGKVCVNGGCLESWILAGMQWAADQDADLVNMSLGGPDTPEVDLLEQAVETLTDQFGVLFVIAAGNAGEFGDGTISSPASADSAVAVGAVDKSDELDDRSSRGPRLDGALKPDMTAPGVQIVAARSADGFLGEPGEFYMSLDGTSMATPHVAGAAAILAQQHPDWSPDQLKTALMNSTAPNANLGPYAQGNGRLDVAQAIEQTVTSSPASVSFERQLFPHDDDRPETQTVTYQNDGDTEVTLNLTLTTIGPDGEPAPEGFFTLSEVTVTVPAGSSADVNITSETSLGDGGFYGGYLTATGDGAAVTTAFAVDNEVESYDVTFVHTDRTGAPTTNYLTTLFPHDRSEAVDAFGSDTVTLRLVAGEYTLMASVNEASEEVSLLAQPSLVIDSDQTVAVDAREARPISVTVPEAGAAPALAVVAANLSTDTLGTSISVLGETFDQLFTGQIGPDQSVDGFVSTVNGAWAQPNPDGGFAGTPYTYHAVVPEFGRMITGLDRDLHRGELAVVRADHAAHAPETNGAKTIFGFAPGGVVGWGFRWNEEMPFSRTEYHTTEGGVQWQKTFEEIPGIPFAEPISIAQDKLTEYQKGRVVRETWNHGVFAPVLLDEIDVDIDNEVVTVAPVSRLGDQMLIVPLLYGDSVGRPVFSPANGTVRVFRNGELLIEEPSLSALVDVPSDLADYRVEIDATRDERLPLSSQTSLAWTFQSAHIDGAEPLPVSVVRFTPSLDSDNTAPAGRPFLVPVEVQHQTGDVESVTVEVSFDDGQTWSEAPIVGRRGRIWVRHPDRDGFVSLRANVTDTEGNTTEQTIIRAYGLRESACPAPDPRETVVVGGVDSGVPNRVTSNGCTVNDLIREEDPWLSHGAFVRHVSEVTGQLVGGEVLSSRERGAIVRAAARSEVGGRGGPR